MAILLPSDGSLRRPEFWGLSGTKQRGEHFWWGACRRVGRQDWGWPFSFFVFQDISQR